MGEGKVRGQSRGSIFIIIGKGGHPHRSLSIKGTDGVYNCLHYGNKSGKT